jgi:HSP20 family protein
MAIIRWNPASDLINLHSELDRLFGDLTEGLVSPRSQEGGGRTMPAFLPIDVERGERDITIRASVPGFKPEVVSVTVDGGVLTVDARHDEEREEKDKEGKNVVRRERYTGRLYRQIALGEGVDADGVQARFENGELVVTVPLVQRPQPRRIEVKASNGQARQEQRLQGERQQERQPATTGAAS